MEQNKSKYKENMQKKETQGFERCILLKVEEDNTNKIVYVKNVELKVKKTTDDTLFSYKNKQITATRVYLFVWETYNDH